MGRAVYIRDDLDGYGAVLAWDGPSRAEGERVTVTDVTLAYDATGPVLSGITIAYPGQPTFPAPPLPLAGETVEAWKARTGAPGSMTDAGDVLLVTLRPGMTDTDLQAVLATIEDPAHVQGILVTLATLRRVASTQWQGELADDTPWPTRPLASLDRDREAIPVPDPALVNADRAAIWADLQAIDDLRAAIAHVTIKAASDATGAAISEAPSPSDPIPEDLPTQTALPVHLAGAALTDGPTGRHWVDDEGTGRIVHARPGASGRVTVGTVEAVDAVPAWAMTAARATLTRAGTYGFACLQTVIGMTREALAREGTATVQVELDHLARKVGLPVRTYADRMTTRRQVHDILRTIAAMRIETGEPRVKVRERGKIVSHAWQAPLMVIEAVLMPEDVGQLTLDGTGPIPRAIRFRGSDRLVRDARIGNRVLPVLGKGNRIDAIPAGQPSGSWARSIAYAAIYYARLRGSATIMLNRRDLLCTYPGDPHPLDLLADQRSARRAVAYWKFALDILRTLNGVPFLHSVEDPDPQTGRGWAAQWMGQSVLMRLHPDAPEIEGIDDVAAGRATYAAQAAARRSGRPPRPRKVAPAP